MSSDWSKLQDAGIEVVTKSDEAYDKARKNYNRRYARYPAAIAFCANAEQVSAALMFAREKHLAFRVRGGRHSYDELSLMDDGLIIDISRLKQFKVLEHTHEPQAVVGAGMRQHEVYQQAGALGFAFPAGTAPSVGVSGVAQGGGIGMMSRAFGLTLDNIVSIQLVKPSGEIVVVSDESQGLDKDLFWALRGGGGGNFGIVTAYTFKLHVVPELSVYEMRWSYDQFIDVMKYWQEWAPSTVRELTCQLTFDARNSVDQGGQPMEVHSEGVFLGDPETLKQLLEPWARAVKPLAGYPRVARMSFLESTEFFASFDSPPHPFKTTGAFAYQSLPEAALKEIVHYLDTAPSKQCALWMQSFGGAFADKAPGDTAFFHRRARFIMEFVGSWTPDTLLGEACARWSEGLRDALREYTHGSYVNFIDLSLSTPGHDKAHQQYLEMYYGGNVQRLREIKTRVDPQNVFDFEQSIPLLPEHEHNTK